MPLSKSKSYFVSKPHVVLRSTAGGGSKVNHLLLGDWLRCLGERKEGWAKIRCRGDDGWLKEEDFSEQRALEVNFVDIGQGDGCHIVTPDDEIILIDAGVGSNMNRFLSWRYNLRMRNVKRDPDFDEDDDEKKPWQIDHVVISHPDNDHYYGFLEVFENPKLAFRNVYHNGIVERPISAKEPGLIYPSRDDLGGYVKEGKVSYIWNVVRSSGALKNLVKAHPKTRKQLISTLRAGIKNSASVSFRALSVPRKKLEQPVFMGPFDNSASLSLQVLGPVTETVQFRGETRECLRKLGNEGVTKNGHSVILKLTYGNLKLMLGGDLNTQSQDYLLRNYTSINANTSSLEKKRHKLLARGEARTEKDDKALEKVEKGLSKVVSEGRATFECDVTKACHHGSAHFTDTFLRVLNPTATVISSGD